MARVIMEFATPWRMLMTLILGASLLVAVATDQLILQLASVAVACLAIFTLFAQLDRRLGRVALSRPMLEVAHGVEARPVHVASRRSPIVTVVIPGKNEASYARDCIQSLKDQTLQNFEAVIVDDCSTDSTLEVVLDAVGGDPRFRMVRTPRSVGIGLARNHGVRIATTKYVTFLDLDDFFAPDALAARVELAERHADQPWVAGAYCWHETVDPDLTPETWLPPRGVPRDTVSWLGHYDDAFFIASAPLLRRDAFLAVGGFDDAPTAEDLVCWFKLMRSGFTLVGTDTVGLAYRRKPTSHAVATAVAMRDTIARLLSERSEAMSAPAEQRGPFFYAHDLGSYRSAVGFTRRTAAALGIAVADGSSDEIIQRLVADLKTVPFPLVGWGVDVRELAIGASKRVTRGRAERGREGPINRAIDQLVGPVVSEAQRSAAAWLQTGEHPALPLGVVARPVNQRKLLPVTPSSLRTFQKGGRPILLLPSAAYHTDELIELVEELRQRGFAPVSMLNDKRWATTGAALSRVDVAVAEALPAGEWLDGFDALLTFNDWGEYFGEYVEFAKGRRTVTFAKVEGVQDWKDDDTGRVRNPYLASDIVLCQGDNDVAALEGRREGLEVVGSARLEAIWTDRLPADADPRVVANVNFTYGVQSEHRDMWVESLSEACRRAGMPLDLSLHPSESAKFPRQASTEPIRHLMVQDSILVSRFSTVLYEGMARGCSVIYYNPHGEKVPTFHHPNGAFDIAEDTKALAELIDGSRARTRAEARERAAGFFASQVSMVPGTSVAKRTADAIERHLAR
jgi:hypothetical protein